MRLKTITMVLVSGLAFAGVNQAMAARSHHRASSQIVEAQSPVNLNDADAATLAAVKGIGPKRASAIVAYRQKNGKFKSVSDLDHVKGFGGKLIARVKGRLTAA